MEYGTAALYGIVIVGAIGAALLLAGQGNTDVPDAGGNVTPADVDLPTTDRTVPGTASPERVAQHIRSGGVPPDGIPPIENPQFVPAGEADFLEPNDIVFGVARNGTVKAYPQSILVWHEIVNDKVGGKNVAVTYCPLTGTALGFERGGTTFGTSGRLLNNNLVMYDRATESWWPQILGTAVTGPMKEHSLEEFRVVWTTWERWRAKHPETEVLSRDTGHARNYNRDPYGDYTPTRSGYYALDRSPLYGTMNDDDRFAPKRSVIGARTADGSAAILLDTLREERVVTGTLGDRRFVAVHDRTLDTAYVYHTDSPVEATAEGYRVNDTVYDADTLPLEQVNAFHAMWFAWAAFFPEANIYA